MDEDEQQKSELANNMYSVLVGEIEEKLDRLFEGPCGRHPFRYDGESGERQFSTA